MKTLITLFLFIYTSIVYAETGLYGSVQLGQADFKAKTLDYNASLKSTSVSFGHMMLEQLGVELRAGTKLGDDEATLNLPGIDIDTRISLDEYYSIYFRPELNIEFIKLYGLFGYTEATLSIKSDQVEDIDIDPSNHGPSYGLGIGIITSDRISINAEYIEIIDSDGFTIDGFNLGVKFFF